mmetsp:Transcript_35598/g.77721  ORF Transcript_35598/g.77721 Transcript_35598/m.77721 type:complete len:238 (-) Transcript_35598:474-1187(-)
MITQLFFLTKLLIFSFTPTQYETHHTPAEPPFAVSAPRKPPPPLALLRLPLPQLSSPQWFLKACMWSQAHRAATLAQRLSEPNRLRAASQRSLDDTAQRSPSRPAAHAQPRTPRCAPDYSFTGSSTAFSSSANLALAATWRSSAASSMRSSSGMPPTFSSSWMERKSPQGTPSKCSEWWILCAAAIFLRYGTSPMGPTGNRLCTSPSCTNIYAMPKMVMPRPAPKHMPGTTPPLKKP